MSILYEHGNFSRQSNQVMRQKYAPNFKNTKMFGL